MFVFDGGSAGNLPANPPEGIGRIHRGRAGVRQREKLPQSLSVSVGSGGNRAGASNKQKSKEIPKFTKKIEKS